MARLVGGVGTSHVPSIGAAIDHDKTLEPYWKPLFDGVEPLRKWAAEARPDVVIVVYNDHASRFGLDLTPTFAIGAGAVFNPHDEGYGPRPVPPCKGDPDFAWHLVESLVLNDEFDVTTVNEMTVDHGLTVPLSLAFGKQEHWPCRVIPVCVNVIQYPQPTASRCYKLGQAIRKAIDTFPADIKVAIFGTGGMSHQLQGERAGLINAPYDNKWLDEIVSSPEQLAQTSHLELLTEAGSEGLEIIMWMVMRGALAKEVRQVHRFYHVPASNTAYGLLVLEDAGPARAGQNPVAGAQG